MDSARLVFGDLMETVFGELAPTDALRIRAVDDVGEIDLGGGRTLTTYYSPGHAQHHVGLLDSLSGDLYVGDAAGIFIPETGAIRPSTPPPDFDLDTALRLAAGTSSTSRRSGCCSATSGRCTHVGPALEEAAEELRMWVDDVRETRADALDLDHAVHMLRERTAERYGRLYTDPELDVKFELLNSTAANINGINRWLDKLEAEQTSELARVLAAGSRARVELGQPLLGIGLFVLVDRDTESNQCRASSVRPASSNAAA